MRERPQKVARLAISDSVDVQSAAGASDSRFSVGSCRWAQGVGGRRLKTVGAATEGRSEQYLRTESLGTGRPAGSR